MVEMEKKTKRGKLLGLTRDKRKRQRNVRSVYIGKARLDMVPFPDLCAGDESRVDAQRESLGTR